MTNQFLVFTGRIPQVVTPATSITNNGDGSKSFWYWDNGKSIKAIQRRNRWKWFADVANVKRNFKRAA